MSRAADPVVSPRLASVVLGLIGLTLGGGVLWVLPSQTGAANYAQLLDASGPGFFPFIAACIAIAAGAWSLADARVPPPGAGEPVAWRRSLQVAGWLGVALVGLHTVGLITALGVMTAGLAVTFGQTRPIVVAALAIGTPLAIHVLFEVTLKILFPRGWLF